jgi:hypothetical protein
MSPPFIMALIQQIFEGLLGEISALKRTTMQSVPGGTTMFKPAAGIGTNVFELVWNSAV